MRPCILPLLLLPSSVLAEPPVQTISITSASAEHNYALFLTAAPTDCPATRFLVVGPDRQAVSAALKPGDSAVLKLGPGFSPGEHQLSLSALGCDAGYESLVLLTLNRSSPGHFRGQDLKKVVVLEAEID